jgi:DNA invertase Pin-like site-specific DNA recombinase
VAIYARISSDPDATHLGVTRQLKDCRDRAKALGWVIGEEYIDNDVSAYGRKPRPEYTRMLDDIAQGERDGVIVYHLDRLTRRPIELEQFVEALTSAGSPPIDFVSGGSLDPANGDNLFQLRVLAALGANESASKSRRVRRKHEEIAAAGRPNGGPRPFGFEPDRVTHRPNEADLIRDLAERYMAGESLRSLATWLNDHQVPTTHGKEWRTGTVSTLLRAPRLAGLREHRGEVVGPALWDPIISVPTHERIVSMMALRMQTKERSPRTHVLKGLLRCSRCGATLRSSPRKERGRYLCAKGPDHRGCGRTSITATPLELLVVDAVLYRLDSPHMTLALRGQAAADKRTAQLSDTLNADRSQLDELAALYASKQLRAQEWLTARNVIDARITASERELARLTRNEALTGLLGNGSELRQRWDTLNLTRQHAIIKAVVHFVNILPGTPSPKTLDPNRVDIRWRL